MASRHAIIKASPFLTRGNAVMQSSRALHTTRTRYAITNFQMPAMSPTMSEGNIASWKKKDGEAFAAGDVLLEIETDKATIDVEAQEDGVMGKILAPDGSKNIPVGKTIALLAEEGDDIANLKAPKEEQAAPSPKVEEPSPPPKPNQERLFNSDPNPPQASSHGPPPEHSRPLFPSVHRLLLENGVTNVDQIKGTGVRGMITKGDVLTFLGKASGPLGTFKFGPTPIEEALSARGQGAKEVAQPLDGPAIRRLIVSSMLKTSVKASNPPPSLESADFDSIIADYLPTAKGIAPKQPSATSTPPKPTSNFLDGLY